jgi:uncharacterized membrane protein YdjX (TVP38/TMEM64 family)
MTGDGDRKRPSSPLRLAIAIGSAAALLGLLAWQGHHLAHWLPRIEQSLAELGIWAPVVYVAVVLALAPLLVPDTIFGVTAGVVFGLFEGFAFYYGAVYGGCLLAYLAGRRWLRARVLTALETRSGLRAMAEAVSRGGLRLTLWIRLVPINPISVSYALGAVGVPFRAVALGTLAIFPHMFLTVYVGVAAAHMTEMAGQGHSHWAVEGVGLLIGLVACAAVVVQISSVAWRQIRAAEEAPSGQPSAPDS